MPQTTLSGPRIGLGALLLGYAVLLFILIGAVPGGSDNSGYFNEARLFAHGQIHAPMRVLAGIPATEIPFLYVPLGFKPAADGTARLTPTYPPGLPLMLAAVARIAGWDHSGDAILLIHSLAGIALVFALGRLCGLPESWSLAGAAVLAASPLYLFTSLQALSYVPATVWATAAVVAAFKSRERTGWALVSGICISIGFLIRPNNFLVAVPVLIAVGMAPRRVLLVVLGSLPGIAVWMAVNRVAYGAPLQSGYGTIGNEFHTALIPGTLRYYVRWLPLLLSPLVFVAPALVGLYRFAPRVCAVLLSWALAYLAFFSAYRWTHEKWWFLRFLLPAAPAIIVAGLVVAHFWFGIVRERYPQTVRRILTLLLLVAAMSVEVRQTGPLREAWSIGHGERKYGRVAAWLNAHVPPDSAIVLSQASGALFYFSNLTLLRYEEMNPTVSARVGAELQSEHRPLYAVLFPFEVETLKKLPGKWNRVVSVDDVSIWRCNWADPAK
ncbi:MAG TPA: glycosyltransferase family 39 protein [Candidatus Solibacter sp.]|nr:glycosyltransferase family 39 protein [Candidatus Solibacter sp.]